MHQAQDPYQLMYWASPVPPQVMKNGKYDWRISGYATAQGSYAMAQGSYATAQGNQQWGEKDDRVHPSHRGDCFLVRSI